MPVLRGLCMPRITLLVMVSTPAPPSMPPLHCVVGQVTDDASVVLMKFLSTVASPLPRNRAKLEPNDVLQLPALMLLPTIRAFDPPPPTVTVRAQSPAPPCSELRVISASAPLPTEMPMHQLGESPPWTSLPWSSAP